MFTWILGANRAFLVVSTSLLINAVAFADSTGAANKRWKAPSKEEFYTTAREGKSSQEQQQADTLRLETVKSIEALLKAKKGGAAQTFELYVRLSELFAERHDYLRDLEISNFEAAFDTWQKGGKKGKEPTLSHDGSRTELTKAANAYRELVRQFPKHARTDEALYSLAKTLVRLGNSNAELYFNQLVQNYKNSKLLPDAYVAMGDFYFDEHKIPQATEAYKKAMNYKDHPYYPYAVFKLGWSYYNAPSKSEQDTRQNLEKAILSFKLVVHLSDKAEFRSGRIDLKKEALKDLITVWADLGDTENSWAYFKEIGEKTAFYDLLERLGGMLAEQGKYDKATTTYTRLLQEDPTRASAPQIYKKLASFQERMNQYDEVLATLKFMNENFVNSSSWTSANSANAELIAESKELTRTSTYRFGASFHKMGVESKNKKLRAIAEKIYTLYLDQFPQTTEAYEVRYYAADLQFDAGMYELAGSNYLIVSKARPKDGKYTKDAALNAVVAADKLDETQKYPALPPRGKVTAPVAIPGGKMLLVNAIDNFLTLLPEDKQAAPLAGEAAEIYFSYGHYPEALKRYQWTLEQAKGSELGINAAKTILGFHLERKDFPAAMAWCEAFDKSPLAKVEKLQTVVDKLHKDAIYLYALAFESKKQWKEAADAFAKFQTTFPSDENADKALFNASQNYYRAGKVTRALECGNTFVEKYTQSKYMPDVIVDLASTHEALGNFTDSAKHYYQLATRFRTDQRSSSALFNAATLWKGLNDHKAAEKAFEAFAKSYPKDERTPHALRNLADTLEAQNNVEGTLNALQAFIDHPQSSDVEAKLYAEAKIVEIRSKKMQNNGKTGLVDLRRKLLAKDSPSALDARRIVAGLMFENIDQDFQSFMSMKFKSPEMLSRDAQARQARLVDVVERYKLVMRIGSPEYTVASLFRLGQLHEGFYKSLFEVQPPAGLAEAAVDKFRSDIEAAALPLRDQAYEFYETAFKRSQEVETFSEWTQKTYAKMSELAPGKHPLIQQKWMSPTYYSYDMFKQDDLDALKTH